MSFQLAHLRSQSMAHVNELDVADDEAFHKGALLSEVSGEYAEVDTGALAIPDGIALARYNVPDDPSFDILGGLGFIPGRMQAIRVIGGDREIFFSAEYVGTLPTEVGGEYGLERSADGKWRVDFAETTATMVRLEDISWAQEPLNKGRVVVTFLDAVGT